MLTCVAWLASEGAQGGPISSFSTPQENCRQTHVCRDWNTDKYWEPALLLNYRLIDLVSFLSHGLDENAGAAGKWEGTLRSFAMAVARNLSMAAAQVGREKDKLPYIDEVHSSHRSVLTCWTLLTLEETVSLLASLSCISLSDVQWLGVAVDAFGYRANLCKFLFRLGCPGRHISVRQSISYAIWLLCIRKSVFLTDPGFESAAEQGWQALERWGR